MLDLICESLAPWLAHALAVIRRTTRSSTTIGARLTNAYFSKASLKRELAAAWDRHAILSTTALRLIPDILQKPVGWNFLAELSFDAGFINMAADGRKLEALVSDIPIKCNLFSVSST